MRFNIRIIPFLLLCLLQACKKEVSNQETKQNSSSTLQLEEGTNMSVALSPDKETLAMDVLGRIYLLSSEGGKAKAITDPLGNARQASWSPDGQKLCFQAYWEGNWHIYTINRDGSNLTQLTQGPFDNREPVWSPKGNQILFSSDQTGNYDIWSYSLENGALQNLSNSPFNQFAPSWRSDGEAYAFIDDHPDQAGIKINIEGEIKLLYSSDVPLIGLSWNPANDNLLFQEGRNMKLLLEEENSTKVLDLSSQGEDLFPFPVSWQSEDSFFYTADGQIKYKDLKDNDTKNIPFQVKVNLDRKPYEAKRRDFDAAQNLPVKGLFMPRLSPDAQQFAIVMLKDVWIGDMDGKMKQITNDPYVEMAPIWSPDQKQLAYISDRKGSFELYLKDLETNKESAILPIEGSLSGLSWSPDGSKIAYALSYGPRLGRLFYYDLEKEEVKAVGGMINSSVGAPSWNPKSKIIALSTLEKYSSRYREGVNGVLYFSIDSDKKWRLKDLEHFSMGVRGYNGPEWSPAGNQLAVISASKLWTIPIDETGQKMGEPQALTTELADAPSWSQDGKKILFLATDRLKILNLENNQTKEIPIQIERERVVSSNKKLIHAGYVFDSNQEKWLINQDIIINQHRIESIGPHQEKNAENVDQVINASDQYVIPGLIDAHSHQGSWEGEKLGRTWLAWGITTTRDPASDPYDALNRREAQEAGKTIGPRIFYTGSPFDGSRIYYGGANALQDEEQIELELNRAALLDYDLIKTYVRLSDPLQKKIIERAHQIGIPVTSHELYPAVTFGIDGMEHILGTSRRGYSPKMSYGFKAYQDVIQLISKSGMSFTPTTGIYTAYNYILAENENLLEDPRIEQLLSPFYLQSVKQGIAQIKENQQENKANFEKSLQMLKEVHENGGLIIAGTDSPIIPYGFSLHIELLSYAAAGLSNTEVLKTATSNAALALKMEKELGKIAPGYLADLLILNADPLSDLKNLKEIDQVIQNGKQFSMEVLLKKP